MAERSEVKSAKLNRLGPPSTALNRLGRLGPPLAALNSPDDHEPPWTALSKIKIQNIFFCKA